MDDIDRTILRLLREDARAPLKTIAAEVGLARSTVRERITKLERDGAILGYRAELARTPGAPDGIRAFLLVRLTRTPATDALRRIAAMPDVRRFFSVTGDLDLVVEVAAGSMNDLNRTRDAIASLSEVADLTTAPVLKVEKEA
jgi:DNA-binding Lrp family transcriptional regulator